MTVSAGVGGSCRPIDACAIPPTSLAFRRAVIRLEHVCKSYVRGRTTIHALHDISLELRDGQFCALVGPSGCGKSTLLALVAGFEVPCSGKISLAGRSTSEFTDADWTNARRELLGMVFQAFHLIAGLTAWENVALPLQLKGAPAQTVKERVRACLEAVRLEQKTCHRPAELSGGEQQRVAIARALAHQPRLLLADEPTGNLDSTTGRHIIALLRSLPQRFGQTVLMATHSATAARLADRAVLMKDGRLHAGTCP
jgi:putative ABC transport system ATP-binding protein